MRLLPLFAFVLIASTSMLAAQNDPPKKRGGFEAATPKPAAKKSGTTESATRKESTPSGGETATPAPKKRSTTKSETGEGSDAPAKKSAMGEKSETAKAPSAADKDQSASAAKNEATSTRPPRTYDAQEDGTTAVKRERAPAATVAPEAIAEFATQPPRVQALITAALELTKLNLTYTYGSADPAKGGMDCSGAMYYLLRSQGFKDVPRDSSSQYIWARKAGPFFSVVSKSAESFEFKDLRPGDLMFWTGTYETGREVPISHVMLYLGTEKKSQKRIMFGSSDGRSYDGIQRWGVSVFDFKMPRVDPNNLERSKVDFVGYGRIPALQEAEVVERSSVAAQEASESSTAEPAGPKPATPKKKRSVSGIRKGS